jgi:hypothetical protein
LSAGAGLELAIFDPTSSKPSSLAGRLVSILAGAVAGCVDAWPSAPNAIGVIANPAIKTNPIEIYFMFTNDSFLEYQ